MLCFIPESDATYEYFRYNLYHINIKLLATSHYVVCRWPSVEVTKLPCYKIHLIANKKLNKKWKYPLTARGKSFQRYWILNNVRDWIILSRKVLHYLFLTFGPLARSDLQEASNLSANCQNMIENLFVPHKLCLRQF